MTNQEIKTVGQTIAQETQIGGNTAARVGGVVEGIGVALDNKDAANGYYKATISGGTVTVNAPNYLLGSGGNLRIKMPSAGTTASTLTIGNANAVQLWYNGAAVSAQNTWEANEIISVFYDGTRFMASNAQGGGGKFATGEKVKDTSITDEVTVGSDDLPTSGAIYKVLYGNNRTLVASDFEQGSGNPTTGQPKDDNTRIRTKDFLQVFVGNTIDFTYNAQPYAIYYYDSSKTFVSATDWISESSTVTINSDGYVKILVRKSNNTNIIPSEYADIIKITDAVSINRKIEKNTEDIIAVNNEIDSTNDRVDDVEEELNQVTQLTSSDFEQGSGNPTTGAREDADRRIRTISNVRVNDGDKIDIQLNGQLYVIYYYTINGAFINATEWSAVDTTINITSDGYVMLLIKKENNGVIVPSELQAVIRFYSSNFTQINNEIADINNEIIDINSNIGDLQSIKYNPLYLGRLQQIGLTYNGFTASTKRVATLNCMVVPHVGATIKVKLPDIYHFGVRSGGKASDLNYNDYWISNGDEYTFRADARFFRISFCKSLTPDLQGSQQVITAEEIQAAIDSGEIVLSLEQENTVFDRNADCEKYVKAIMRPFVSGATNNYSLTKLPTFAHISDLHGDAKRFKQFMEYAAFLNVDAAFVTGDMVAWQYVSHKEFVDDIAKMFDIPDMQCLGNHECANNRPMEQQAEMIASCIERNGCTVDALATYPTYYYKDFADKQIRIIALNTYEGKHTLDRWYWPKAQCDWFIQTLASTPANYGVIVLSHAPETIPPIDSTYNLFRQPILNYTSAGLSEKPFAHIIDAFIGKTSATISYTSSEGTAVTSQADFTSVNAGVEFIAYANGHLHTDTIGYLPDTTYKQLVLNVCCGISVYGTLDHYLANNSDLPRDAEGATQDSFNVYVVDRANGVVRVAKVGSHISGAMTDRNWMIIPYKDIT